MSDKEVSAITRKLIKTQEQMDNNPLLQKEIMETAERYQRRYGTVTQSDLDITITI